MFCLLDSPFEGKISVSDPRLRVRLVNIVLGPRLFLLYGRVHRMLPSFGDIVCVDATSNLDRSDAKMFNFICPSPVGGLRIAYVIVSTESEELQADAFSAIKDLLDQELAFYKRVAAAGPKVFTFCVNGIN